MDMAGVGAISIMLLGSVVITLVTVKPGGITGNEVGTTQSGMDLV